MQRKGPLPGKIFARCIPKRRFAGLFGYTTRIASIYRHSQPPENALRILIAVPDRLRTNRGRILPAKPHFQPRKSPECSFLPRLTRAHPRDAAVPCCGDARRRDGGVGAGRHWGAGLPAAGRHWRSARWAQGGIGVHDPPVAGALVCAVCRCGALSRGTAPSAAGMRGRGVEPSTAGDTGYEANCAAKALMNPFTPTFPRYGAVIEINCYATNN